VYAWRKIIVYSIFPITKDEAGLATVIGHEVSHALANHGTTYEWGSFKDLVPLGSRCNRREK
jgi:predicted Zn-dependent protease